MKRMRPNGRGGDDDACHDTLSEIEELIESYGLSKFKEEVEDEKALNLEEAKEHYAVLSKD